MEFNNPEYIKNAPSRCFYCKTELYTHLNELSKNINHKIIINGANIDDTNDFRPGMKAAKQHEVFSPLIDAKFTKKEIRLLSKKFNLPTWDKPAQPCLASRIPYGTPVSIDSLSKIGQAESSIRKLGFKIIRVRHYNDLAKITKASYCLTSENLKSILPKTCKTIIAKHLSNNIFYIKARSRNHGFS